MPIAHIDFLSAKRGVPFAFPSGLHRELHDLNSRLRELLPAGRRLGNEDPLQPFRGLVISDEEATCLLEELDQWLARPEQTPRSTLNSVPNVIPNHEDSVSNDCGPLTRLCRTFRLSPEERRCLVAALAPELDSRYERVFAFLQDDVTRKVPSVGLLLDLIEPREPWTARRLFLPGSPLLRWQLLHIFDRSVGEPSSFLAKGVRLDYHIVEYLLDAEFDRSSSGQREIIGPAPHNTKYWQTIREVLLDCRGRAPNSSIVFVLSGPAGVGQRELAEWLACEAGLPLFWTSAKILLKESGNPQLVVREAKLRGGALAVDRTEIARTNESLAEGLAELAELAREHLPLTFLLCDGPWHTPPSPSASDWFVVELPLPTSAERLLLWEEALGDVRATEDNALPVLAARFPLAPEQIRNVANQLRQAARLRNASPSSAQLQQLCRAYLHSRVSGVSESEPQRTWLDLVLPDDVRGQLEELCGQARQRATVLGRWGFDAKLSGGKGLHALFSGPPGTGKTLAAEVIAGALGRRLWRIDLSQMVSKYIGETEKNLDRVFRAADSAEAVLFFDEADALFGKRSEVRDAHDRYANQEVSYLLQQMDEYEGVAVLATNLARNLDEAFVRRLQFVVEFPFPDEEQRRRIWETIFPEAAPRGVEVDFLALARSVRLSGGHIRNIALAAAFAAADDTGVIQMRHLWHAARREYQKIGQDWTPPAQTRAAKKEP
jgi:AAA+ superfamily predicted ATPase